MRKLIFSLTRMLSFGLVWAKSDKSPVSSLNSCQDAVRKEAKKFMHKKMDAIGRCLQDVSKQIVKKGMDASGAAESCIRQFGKIGDLETKLIEKINKKCDPTLDKVTHTEADILDAGDPFGLQASNLDVYCASFASFGAVSPINSLDDWSSCVAAASECAVDSAIAAQYPRASEWLGLVETVMPDGDAKIALGLVKTAIDSDGNGVPDITCGPSGGGDEVCPCNFSAALLFPPVPPMIMGGEGPFDPVTISCTEIGTGDSRSRDVIVGSVVFGSALLKWSTVLSVGVSECSAFIEAAGPVDQDSGPFIDPVTVYGEFISGLSAEEVALCTADIGAIPAVCPVP